MPEQALDPDIARVRGNLQRMIDQGASELEMDDYVASEGMTANQLRAGARSGGGVAPQFAGGFNEILGAFAKAPRQALEPVREAARATVGMATGQEPSGETAPRYDPFSVAARVGEYLQSELAGPPPVTGAERIARRAGQEVAMTAPLAGMTAIAAASRPLQGAVNAGQRVLQSYLAPIRATPGRALVGEAAAAVGAGTGAGAAREVAPESPLAEAGGQLAGGVAPSLVAVTPTALALRGGKAIASKFTKGAGARRAREAAADVIGAETTETAARNIEEAEALAARIEAETGRAPEFTLAEKTRSEALRRTQEDIEARAQGAELEAMAARRERGEEAIAIYGEQAAPEADEGIEYVFDTATKRVRDLTRRVGTAEETAEAGRRGVAEDVPAADRAETGARMRERLVERRTQIRDELDSESRRLGIDGIDTTDEMIQLADDIEGALAPISRLADTTKLPRPLRDLRRVTRSFDPENIPQGAEPPEPLTFRDIKALRERVSDDLIDELGSAKPSRKAIRNLVVMRKRIDDAIERIGQGIDDPGLAERYRQFRADYFEKYINRFERGTAYKIRQRDGRAFYRMPDERVADAFFSAGEVTAARQFRDLFGTGADDLIEAAALDSLRQAAVRDGVIDERPMASWLRRHRSVLDEFPALRQRVVDIDGANSAVASRQAQLAGRRQTIQDSILAREAKAVERGTRTPADAANRALKNPKILNALMRRLDTDGEAALARHVWDEVKDAGGDRIAAFIETNRKALTRVLGESHIRHLEVIQRARQMLDFTAPPRGAGYKPNALGDFERVIGQRVPVLASRVYALKTGRVQKGYLMVDALTRSFLGRQQATAEDMMKLALYDPKVARELSTMIRHKRVAPAGAKRLNVWLFNLGTERDREERR